MQKDAEVYFDYGEKEMAYLRQCDAHMAAVIDRLGHLHRRVIPDLFAALIHSIVGQQISTRAHETIWGRLVQGLGVITPALIASLQPEQLRAYGLSGRKVGYMQGAAQRVLEGDFDMDLIRHLPDEEACLQLQRLDGIGRWSAEMLLLFSLQRPDVLSMGDLGIQRGLRMVYHHRRITPRLFQKYRRRFSPYGSVASLYLWAVAGGVLPDMNDPAPRRNR